MYIMWWKRKVEPNEKTYTHAHSFARWNNERNNFKCIVFGLLCDKCCHIWLTDTIEFRKRNPFALYFTLFFFFFILFFFGFYAFFTQILFGFYVCWLSVISFSRQLSTVFFFIFFSTDFQITKQQWFLAFDLLTFNYSFWYDICLWQYNDMVRFKTCAITHRKSW